MPIEIVFENLFLAGVAALVIGCLWILIVAFRTNWKWGLGILLVPPASFWFAARYPRKGLPPLLFVGMGVLGMTLPAILTRTVAIDLGPYESIVDRQRHMTLTGWDQTDYSFLKQETDIIVLQMANADVTDDTLKFLVNLQRLKELDISNSRVTDEGLAHLLELPRLETLRLAGTAVTEAGFRQHLSQHPTLSRVDASGTSLTPDFVDWASQNTRLQIMY